MEQWYIGMNRISACQKWLYRAGKQPKVLLTLQSTTNMRRNSFAHKL